MIVIRTAEFFSNQLALGEQLDPAVLKGEIVPRTTSDSSEGGVSRSRVGEIETSNCFLHDGARSSRTLREVLGHEPECYKRSGLAGFRALGT